MALEELEAVHPRHDQVGDDDRRAELGNPLEGVGAVTGFVGRVAPRSDELRQPAAGGFLVLDDQHALGVGPRPLAHWSECTIPAKRWSPVAQWQSLLEVVLCSGFPTQLVADAGWPAWLAFAPTTGDGALSLPFVAAVSAADTVLLVALVLWLLRIARRVIREGSSW